MPDENFYLGRKYLGILGGGASHGSLIKGDEGGGVAVVPEKRELKKR